MADFDPNEIDGDDIVIKGASDSTHIGNVSDKLKVIDQDAIDVLNTISLAALPIANIFKKNEATVTSRNETDLPSVTYTVPAGKSFAITTFVASYDFASKMFVRVKKQTGGTGPFETLFKMVMMSGGQGDATLSYDFGAGIKIGDPTDVIKITYESSIAKGTLYAEFSGSEY